MGDQTPAATSGPTHTTDTEPSASGTATASPAPAPPSAIELIEADLAAGVIDEPTATLYRVFAMFADDRLPEKYWTGVTVEDNGVLDAASEAIDTYPAEIQEQLRPFLLRPTDARSYWAPEASAAVAAQPADRSALALAAAPPVAVSACVNGWITRAPPTVPAIVWGQCGFSIPEADALQRVTEVTSYIEALWAPMTALMGPPIGDRSYVGDPVPEANDGKLDIYIVDYANNRHTRSLDAGSHNGVCFPATPYSGPSNAYKSSTYIVINGPVTGTGPDLKATVAHEFFHSLESAHNRTGLPAGRDFFWMFEASAVWAEHQFVPEARHSPYFYWDEFRGSPYSLSSLQDRNEYNSWAWPLFVAQEKGPAGIAAIWGSLEGKSGFTDLQSAVDNHLPFETRFRDFAVRVWNEKLEPGDPIRPRFQAWDSGFPLGRPPFTPRWHYKDDAVAAQSPGDPPHEVVESIPSLWAAYATLKLEEDVGQLVVDFSGLTPQSELDVDALVKAKDKDWERRKLPNGMTRFCRDKPEDNVEQVIFVLSNHDLQPQTTITGKWTYQGLANSCADLSGTLTITRLGYYESAQGEPLWTRDEDLSATLFVDMVSDPDPFGGGGYIDSMSKFQVHRTTLEQRKLGDCTASYGTKSDGTWGFADVTVPEYENSITGFVDYQLLIVVLAVVAHYPSTTTENICNLIDPNPEHAVHDAFGCTDSGALFPGTLTGKITEVEGAPDTVTFNCREEGPALGLTIQTISVTGTLTLDDEGPSPAP